jgi:hypothetical protein
MPTGPRKARPDDRLRIEPGISRFPDAQLRIRGLALTRHPGMTEPELSVASLLTKTVILRHRVSPSTSPMTGSSGVSCTSQLFGSIAYALGYWIARRSLSSGGHSADPLAGDDG